MKYIAFPQEEKNRNILFSYYNYDYNSPACEKIHFHKYYEFIIIEHGTMEIFIDGVSYVAKDGECVIIQPYQAHSFHLNENSKNLTYNFLKNYASSFDAFNSQKRILKPIFTISSITSEFIINKSKELFGRKQVFRSPPDKKYETDIKAITYSLCSEFLKSAEFTSVNTKSQNIIMEVIEYICDNFEQNISLKEFALKHNYNYQYLSRRFNTFFDTGFKEVLNRYRIEQAISYLEETDLPISSIAFASGFQSIRSFNDACLKYYNKTPSKIRKK
ncbi:MAG: helix-turn-helix transcriptional regulator [Clostridia bacterium]|nr:helix-turn-helix transcriptional regulator [Clostridia bacterium]